MRKSVGLTPAPGSFEPHHAAQQSDGTQRELWKLLDALALCRRQYNLTSNSLSVLRALISFLPKTAPATEALIVWPSNRTLCERADGMDERTLRRHVDRLVKAGLIHRRSSSNGKRFALRCRKVVVTAFGFDLEPLRDRTEEIADAAQTERNQAEHGAALRVEILNLLHALGQNTNLLDADEEAEIRRMLRRRSDLKTLSETRDELLEKRLETGSLANELTVSDSQIDRHQQKTEKDSYESVCDQRPEPRMNAESRDAKNAMDHPPNDDITLIDCLQATTESRAFAQEPVRSWTDLMRLADMLAPMIGIERELAEHSKRAMGPLQAAISILCLVQRSDHIQRPAAYLRRLAILAESGQYSLKSLVRSAMSRKFAGVNHVPT